MNSDPKAKAGSSKAILFLIVALFLGCGSLAYYAAQLWRQQVNAETEIAQLRAQVSQSASTAALQAQNDVLRARIAELEAQHAAAVVPAAPTVVEPTKPQPMAQLGALASQMMNTPAMREMMVRSQRVALERRFTELMNQLGLSPQDRTRFIDLLAQKQMNTVEIGLKMMSGNTTAEERTAVARQIKEANAAVDSQIRDFFGGDTPNYAAYQDYAAQQPMRTQVTALGTGMAAAGAPLSPDQANALAGVMTEARRNFTFTRDFEDPTNMDPQTRMNGPAMDAYFREQQQLQDQVAERSAAFLSPEQVAALRQSQTTRLEQARKSMEMARQLMGGGK